MIRRYCYRPDGVEPVKGLLARDLQWFRVKLAQGEDPHRIESALRGAPVLWDLLHRSKWSPAKVFTKRGQWVSLYERAIHADMRIDRKDKQRIQSLGEILGELVRKAGGGASHDVQPGVFSSATPSPSRPVLPRRSDTVRRGPSSAGPKLNGMTTGALTSQSGQRGDAPGPTRRAGVSGSRPERERAALR